MLSWVYLLRKIKLWLRVRWSIYSSQSPLKPQAQGVGKKRWCERKLKWKIVANLFVFDLGMQLKEVGDFGDENCLPALNLIRSTKLHLTAEPPISCRCCYRLAFSVVWLYLLICPARKFKSINAKNKVIKPSM